MIAKLEVKGFRILRDFAWLPNKGVNLLVGTNSAGKTTVLEAIELVAKGGLHGQRVGSLLSPDWFNIDLTNEYFESLSTDNICSPPEISIAAQFESDPALAGIQGCNGPQGASVDAPGLWLRIFVPRELIGEFTSEAQAIVKAGGARALPVEYYTVEWQSFKGVKILRRPDHVTCSRIDTRPEPYSRTIDSFAKSLIDSSLDDDQLRDVNRRIRNAHAQIDQRILSQIVIDNEDPESPLGLQLDKSPRSDWKNSVVLERKGLPFAVLGSAEQIMTKCRIAMGQSVDKSILLFEEPECHLSHTSLNELISLIEKSVGDNQQVFVTTHSPFVLNRLGLDRLSVLSSGRSPLSIGELSEDTVKYFKKLSGYDTLRIVLAEKAVLVEGPTDEMVFDWAFRKMRGTLPKEKGIDVIEYGIRYKRALELASAIGKEPLVALRDNDDKPESKWLDEASGFVSEKRILIVGHDGEGATIEPQMVMVNSENLDLLAEVTGSSSTDAEGLTKHLMSHKVEWSLSLLEAAVEKTENLKVPRYISEAIDFLDPEGKSQ